MRQPCEVQRSGWGGDARKAGRRQAAFLVPGPVRTVRGVPALVIERSWVWFIRRALFVGMGPEREHM
eukprot:5024168-Lingulodinium_polyedra.AAC.1